MELPSIIETVSDWCWENRLKFCGALGALGVLGFGIGTAKAPNAIERALELADNNLLDVGDV